MSEKEGTLRKTASDRWAVYRPGRLPVEITSGGLFRVEVAGAKELQLTRMKYNHSGRGNYSVDGYPLRDMVCAPRSARLGKKFRQRSQQFAVCRAPRAAATLRSSPRARPRRHNTSPCFRYRRRSCRFTQSPRPPPLTKSAAL
jgi:hypothetical protein